MKNKKLNIKKNTPLLVEWNDATGIETTRFFVKHPYKNLAQVKNVGFFVSEDEKTVVISSMLTEKEVRLYEHLLMIPKCLIKSIKVLELKQK